MNDELDLTLKETISNLAGDAAVSVERQRQTGLFTISITPSENTPQGNVQVGAVLGQISVQSGKLDITLHPPKTPEAGGASILLDRQGAIKFLEAQQVTGKYETRLQETSTRLNEAARPRT